jgi:hypothetical protein
MIQMADMTKPQIQDFADINDYFVALDEYYAASIYADMTVTAA